MILRKALAEEVHTAYQCIEDARKYHRALEFVQWYPAYPTVDTLREDVEKGVGFVITENDEILGYCCIICDDEPAYNVIDGAWRTDRPYAVIHRLAFSDKSRGKGMSAKAFLLIKNYCLNNGIAAIRVDTQEENKVMQHILLREGFACCGTVTFDGGPKLAYEWDA